MTTLELGKSVTRKTAASIQRRPLVVRLYPAYMELRRAGTRTAFALSYETAYVEAAKRAANKLRADRAEAKRAKSAERKRR